MKKVKRLAGASAGSLCAALLAVGCTSKELEGFLSENFDKIFLGVYTDTDRQTSRQAGRQTYRDRHRDRQNGRTAEDRSDI
jgi:predicted acylesterase/phospholipase RssA